MHFSYACRAAVRSGANTYLHCVVKVEVPIVGFLSGWWSRHGRKVCYVGFRCLRLVGVAF